MTLAGVAARIRAGELSPREAVAEALARIESLQGTLNAFISVRGEEALAEADALSGRVGRGPLHGVPVAVKDVIDVAGARTTAASRILADNVAAVDATVVARLRSAGAVVVGKLNTHEFAWGATTTSPHFGPARNPWDTERICGGSSGGSGAAVAAGLVPGALGTDTAGSVRIPACLCGVTGVRPSLGRVPNSGVVPVSWTFDAVGPLARTAEDCALLLQAIAGHDVADPTTVDAPVPAYSELLDGGVLGLRVGVVSHLLEGAIDPRVAAAVEAAVAELSALGARVERVDASFLRETEVVQQLIMLPEAASAHLPWLRTRLADYGADVRARLLAGLLLPGTAVVTGQRARRRLYAEALGLLARVDLLVAPQMPVVAPRIGEDTVDAGGATLPYRLSLIPFNSPWSCLGLPVASVPCGVVDGLPVGMAIVGRRLDETGVLRAAHTFQLASDWHTRVPPTAA
ncbi:MAG: amidase [Thermoleophilia bacterium]|nr:amidase [Thermoleophilia bacterium]MDH5332596.1 amidase [Thermoleophilia bacterium]